MNIRPISDLRNRYGDVEKDVNEKGPVFLTKNGYGSMVVMSMEQYEYLNGTVEDLLDAADRQASTMPVRYTHEEVFGSIRQGSTMPAPRGYTAVPAIFLGRLGRRRYLYSRETPQPRCRASTRRRNRGCHL